MSGITYPAKRGGHFSDVITREPGHFARGGYLGLDEPSRPFFADTKRYARGGYLGLDAPETPERINTQKSAFAAGGHAPVVKATRAATKKDIAAARKKASENPLVSGGGETQPLAAPKGYFGAGSPRPPQRASSAFSRSSSRPGYFN